MHAVEQNIFRQAPQADPAPILPRVPVALQDARTLQLLQHAMQSGFGQPGFLHQALQAEKSGPWPRWSQAVQRDGWSEYRHPDRRGPQEHTLQRLVGQARRSPRRIVLPEGGDARVLQAAVHAQGERIARITLVGSKRKLLSACGRDRLVPDGIDVVDPGDSPHLDRMAEHLLQRRRHKGMTRRQAEEMARTPLYFAQGLVGLGLADGSVSGAAHTTAEVVRSAVQVIGLHPASRLVSSFFLMLLRASGDIAPRELIFSDCGLVVEPDEVELAEIAIAAADSAQALLMQPARVAMLSFSTGSSASHPLVHRVVWATQRVRALRPDLAIDGEVQLDVALIPDIARRKLPQSRLGGNANVLIFPDLHSGNIGYELAERIGGATAIGSILQGLRRPANDLSRGCSTEDIFNAIAVTVIQAQPRTTSPVGLETSAVQA